ncbi:MAG: mannose-6-phosphate isomerase [Candidatus Pacearchaeota archaeon]
MKKPLIDRRPWGYEEIFTKNKKTSVKILHIKPKKRNSLQLHKNRTEFLYLLDNPIKAVIGTKTLKLKKGKAIWIKKGVKHRLIGMDKEARILEISFGKFYEKDIKRLEDDFGRV